LSDDVPEELRRVRLRDRIGREIRDAALTRWVVGARRCRCRRAIAAAGFVEAGPGQIARMNKPIVNVEAKAFLVVFAVATSLLGAYGVFGTLLLRGDGVVLSTWGFALLLAIATAALGAGLIALLVVLNDRVGGWWLVASALATVAWFATGHLVVD
jgi:hypothetical protein